MAYICSVAGIPSVVEGMAYVLGPSDTAEGISPPGSRSGGGWMSNASASAHEQIEERAHVDRLGYLGVVHPASRSPCTCSSVMRYA